MSKKIAVARYHLIVNKLRKHPSTFEEIGDYLDRESNLQGEDFVISYRTFRRDLDDIFSLFSIDVRYDYSRRVYYIHDDETELRKVRMLEAYNVFHALNIGERVSRYLHFDRRTMSGTEHLQSLLEAIDRRLVVQFNYTKYWQPSPQSAREVCPLALKEFRNRWYLLAQDNKDGRIKSFGLERLSDLKALRQKFVYPEDFDVANYFQHCYGIVAPNADAPEEVLLVVKGLQANYLKSLPLHPSQEIVFSNEEELHLKLRVFITHDLVMELLSYGEEVEVQAPARLRRMMTERLKETLAAYGSSKK